jgi:hypothetical protein
MLKCLLSKKGNMLDSYHISFRALPLIDTDVSRLFSQAYTTFTGLARWHFIFSSEIGPVAVRNRWIPVTVAETVSFKRSIKSFEKIDLRTEIVCWNEKCFFIRQTFSVKGETRAIAYSEGIVRGPTGHLKPAEAFKIFGAHIQSPEIPEQMRLWHAMHQIESSEIRN